MTALIETRGVARHYGGGGWWNPRPPVRAVDGVDLAVRRGETLAIVGESGCGKSTLARLMAGLVAPSAGQVLFDGADVASAPRDLRRRLQFVFQDPFASLNPRASVGTIVGEPIETHEPGLSAAARRDRVAAMLERVGLRPEHLHRYPHEFSGGQRQRIGIARALACGPDLVIGDEPVSALDVSVQAQVINLLADLKADLGLTLVVIAHDLAVIRHMGDRVAVMYLGRVVETAPVDDLFARPRHPYTRALLSAIPVPRPGRGARGDALSGDIPSPAAPPPGCRFHTRCPFARGDCASAEPALTAGPDGHAVACHHWAAIAAAHPFAGPPEGTGRTPAAERRMRLYRTAVETRTAAPQQRTTP